MYFYIYDTFVNQKKYEREIGAIETRLTDLGISGKIGRLNAFSNARGLIRDELRHGAQTIVVVGNDDTIAKVIEGIEDTKLTLGIIPLGDSLSIASALGIPFGVDACDVLAKRITQKIDLGKVNGRYFLTQLQILRGKLTMEADGCCKISTLSADCELIVRNLRRTDSLVAQSQSGNPKDGFLDALIMPKTGMFENLFSRGKKQKISTAASVIPLRTMIVTSEEPVAILADGREFRHNNLSIEVVPEKLKVITGRERVFA